MISRRSSTAARAPATTSSSTAPSRCRARCRRALHLRVEVRDITNLAADSSGLKRVAAGPSDRPPDTRSPGDRAEVGIAPTTASRVEFTLRRLTCIACRIGQAGRLEAGAAKQAGVAAAAGGAVRGGVVAGVRQRVIDAQAVAQPDDLGLGQTASAARGRGSGPCPSTPAFVARLASPSKAAMNSGRQSGYPE